MVRQQSPAAPSRRSIALVLFVTAAPLCATRAQSGACQNDNAATVVHLMTLLDGARGQPFTLDKPSNPNESDTGREMRLMLRDHIAKYAPAETLRVMEVREYCRHYSEEEIKALSAFYSSPLGQKAMKVQREVTDSMTARSEALMSPHREELRAKTDALIKARIGLPQ